MREKKSNTFEGLAIRMKIQGETVGERCFEKIAGSVRDAVGPVLMLLPKIVKRFI